jgi:hypothetical protein
MAHDSGQRNYSFDWAKEQARRMAEAGVVVNGKCSMFDVRFEDLMWGFETFDVRCDVGI